MIPNRKKLIPILLTVYLVLTVFACVKLPTVFSDADNPTATVSAPLALPEDMQQRLAEHTAGDADSDVISDDADSDVIPDDADSDVIPDDTDSDVIPDDTDSDVIPDDTDSDVIPDDTDSDVTPDDTDSDVLDDGDDTDVVPDDAEDDDAADDADSDDAEDKTAAPQVLYIATSHAGVAVNVREAATRDSEIVAQFYDGDPVTVLSVSGKWYQVQKDEVVGYVFQDFLSDHE